MQKAVSNDEMAAWTKLVESLAKQYINNRDGIELEDLVQEGYIGVLTALQKGIYPGRKAIQDSMRDYCRKIRRQTDASWQVPLHVVEHLPADTQDPVLVSPTEILVEDYYEFMALKDTTRKGLRFVHLLADLDAAIKRLSPTERKVVYLCGKLNFTTRHTGEVLGMSKDTVNRHYRRALDQLGFILQGRKR